MEISNDYIETPSSSVISRFRYDPESEKLTIEFKHGGVYDFFGVPNALVEEFKEASSKGQFFGHSIRNQYPYIETGRGRATTSE
jgi:lysyl-tRNA synthetase class 2